LREEGAFDLIKVILMDDLRVQHPEPVGERLYRSCEGVYVALIRASGKQIKRRLGTKGQQLVKRRLKDSKRRRPSGVGTDSDDIRGRRTTLAGSDRPAAQGILTQKEGNLREQPTPIFGNKGVRQIGTADVEHWKKKRAPQLSERSYNMEMDTLRLVLDYCRDDPRLILDHSAERLQKKKTPKTKAVIPTREQFLLINEWRGLMIGVQGAANADRFSTHVADTFASGKYVYLIRSRAKVRAGI